MVQARGSGDTSQVGCLHCIAREYGSVEVKFCINIWEDTTMIYACRIMQRRPRVSKDCEVTLMICDMAQH